jgi:hypothetical protein
MFEAVGRDGDVSPVFARVRAACSGGGGATTALLLTSFCADTRWHTTRKISLRETRNGNGVVWSYDGGGAHDLGLLGLVRRAQVLDALLVLMLGDHKPSAKNSKYCKEAVCVCVCVCVPQRASQQSSSSISRQPSCRRSMRPPP